MPFRDHQEIDELGLAGYLKLIRDGDEYSGAIFVVNARGEPVHFVCNRVRVISRFMWREEDIAQGATQRLLQSLFMACPVTPVLVLCHASETPEQLLEYGIHGAPLVGCIATTECLEVTWYPQTPAFGTPAFTLWELLSTRGLLHEPFTRAAKGMAEILRTRPKHEISPGSDIAPDSTTGRT
ncbi:MAG: hypothetical protein Q8P44_08770 [Dehalococcoidia bacterium]|nr:hypothetical protein [Dehalococcoidia bacterium]